MEALSNAKYWLLFMQLALMLGCQSAFKEEVDRLEKLSKTIWPTRNGKELIFLSPTTGCGSCLESGNEFLQKHLGHERLKAVIVAPSKRIGQMDWGDAIAHPSVRFIADPTEYTQGLANGGFALFFFENGKCVGYEAATPNTATQLALKGQQFLYDETIE